MKNCPYCGAPGISYFKISSRTYNRCLRCYLIYKERQDFYDKVLSHYCNDYFVRYSADQMSGERDRLFSKILDLIKKRRDTGSLLDVGTGCGFFLVAAQKKGWKVKGIDNYGFSDINIYNSPPTEGKRCPEDDAYNV